MKIKKRIKKSKKLVKNKPARFTVKNLKTKDKKIGKIIHYFDQIKVAVIKLILPLKIGDKIRIIGGEDTDFKQVIKSMEIDHKKIKIAKKGKSIGIKTTKKVREGYSVYKI